MKTSIQTTDGPETWSVRNVFNEKGQQLKKHLNCRGVKPQKLKLWHTANINRENWRLKAKVYSFVAIAQRKTNHSMVRGKSEKRSRRLRVFQLQYRVLWQGCTLCSWRGDAATFDAPVTPESA